MKKKFTIEVTINRGIRDAGETRVTKDGFKVIVNPSVCRESGFLTRNVLAHEFGHVLALVTGFGYAKELKVLGWSNFIKKYNTSKKFRMRIENEAWNLARFIRDRKNSIEMHEEYGEYDE